MRTRVKTQRQRHQTAIDDALIRFERFERRVDDLEELEAMDLGRTQPNLEAEIDALAKDDVLNEELEASSIDGQSAENLSWEGIFEK